MHSGCVSSYISLTSEGNKVIRRLLLSLLWAGVLVTLLDPPAFAATVGANWVIGPGNWTDSYNWTYTALSSYGHYPNDGGQTYYDVTINSGVGDSVTLSSGVTVRRLRWGR